MKKQWFHIFTSNPLLKIFSIALAIALSLLVREDRIKEITVEVPLIMADLGEDRVFTGELRPTVRIRMRGRSSSILRVIERNPSDYQYTVDLRGYEFGDTYVFEEERLSRLIGVPGVSVVAIEPHSFSVDVEPRLEKEVSVELEAIGSPDPEYEVDQSQIRYQPKRVKLYGPPSQLAEVDSMRIPVDLTGLSKDVIREVRLKPPFGAEHMTLEFDRVSVEIPVREKMGEERIEGINIEVRGCGQEMECVPSAVSVSLKVKGPLWRIRQLRESPVEGMAFIDATKFAQNPRIYRRVKVRTRSQEGLSISTEPRTVNLNITLLESDSGGTGAGSGVGSSDGNDDQDDAEGSQNAVDN